MKEMKIFSHEMFGEIRTMTNESGETYFVGKDVAEALGYNDPQKAIKMHVDDDDKLIRQIVVSGQNRNCIIISESGLYSLVLSSKLPQAKVFKHWVTSEVLPQIRKTGGYIPTHDAEGELHTRTYLVWTEKGRKFIHRMCKTEEIMIPFLLSVEVTNEEV